MPKVKREKQPKIVKNYLPHITNPARNWTFTQQKDVDNNLVIEDFTEEVKSKIRYLVYQHEICPQTGKHHWQGFIQAFNPIRYSTINKLLPKLFGAHFEQKFKNSTPEQAANYCKKVESRMPDTLPFEFGTITSQGERTDLEAIQDKINNGVSLRKIADENFAQWCLHRRAFAEYAAMKMPAFQHEYTLQDYITEPIPESELNKKSIHLYGPPGIGKTKYALAHFQNPLLLDSLENLKNLNPTHDGLVFDDMSFKHIPGDVVIKILDMDFDRTVKVLYGTITIPRGLRRIFTHNDKDIFYIDKQISEKQKGAIERRVIHKEILEIKFRAKRVDQNEAKQPAPQGMG